MKAPKTPKTPKTYPSVATGELTPEDQAELMDLVGQQIPHAARLAQFAIGHALHASRGVEIMDVVQLSEIVVEALAALSALTTDPPTELVEALDRPITARADVLTKMLALYKAAHPEDGQADQAGTATAH